MGRKDRDHPLPNKFIYYPDDGGHGYFDKALNRRFETKKQKRQFLNEHKMLEDGTSDRERKRQANHIVEQINVDRKKQGLKPKTKQELVGDSWRR